MERRTTWRDERGTRPIDACAAARLTLSAGIDGESAELEQEAALRHAAGCQACQAFAAESEQLSATLRAAAVLSPSPPLAPDIQRRRIPRSAAGVGGSVAAVLVAARCSARWSRPGSQQAPSRPPAAELRLANLDTRQAQLIFPAAAGAGAARDLPASIPRSTARCSASQLG